MSPEAPVIPEGAYLGDLRAQPQALRDTLRSLAGAGPPRVVDRVRRDPACRVVLTGMGSSLHALYTLHLGLLSAGVDSCHVESAELLGSQRALLAAAGVVIAVSQSGASAEIVRLARDVPDPSCLLAVTNTPGSPLAQAAGEVVLLRAGAEATVSCKTYLATLAALAWIAAQFEAREAGGRTAVAPVQADLADAANAVEAYLADLPARAGAWGPLLAGVRTVFVVGRGASLAAAWTGALINKEAAGVPVEGMSSAAFRHGPFEMAGPSTLVLVLEGVGEEAELNRRLVRDVRAAGGRAECLVSGTESPALWIPAVPDRVRPLVEILPLQILSLALAAREGREAGRFVRATKVTAVE